MHLFIAKYLTNQTKNRQHLIAALVVVLLAVVGTTLLLASHAATPNPPYTSTEAESGDPANGAAIQPDNTASNNSSVVFKSAFVPGVCNPSPCVASTYQGYTLTTIPEASAPPYGDVTSPTIDATRSFRIERPTNLSTSTPVPVVLAAAGTTSGDPQWIAASATDKFVLVQVLPNNPGILNLHITGSAYGVPTTAPAGGPLVGCGTSSPNDCDDIPYVQKILSAIECTGSPPCENVNPKEVYMEGGSKGGSVTQDVMCDTRTSSMLAGVSIISYPMFSTGADSSIPPKCPALLGISSACLSDCVSAPINHNVSIQWLYGTADPIICTGAVDCMNTGLLGGKGFWEFANPMLATSVIGVPILGCPSSPSSTATSGNTGKILTTTYTPCSKATTPSNTATQTISITGAGHIPEGTSSGGDGIDTQAAAWNFWTTYPSL